MKIMIKVLCGVGAVFLSTVSEIPTPRAQVPGLRGVDHVGLTVPNLQEAVKFFVNVVGCEEFFSNKGGPRNDDWMKENLNVDPRATATNHRVRCGDGANFELFEYQSPDQRTVQPKNSDYGGHHLAFYVDDIEATVAYLRSKGLRVFGDIKTNAAAPTKGLSWIYVLAPWGTQLEFLSYPKGLEYEKTTTKRLWDPRGCAAPSSARSCQ
jgi:catechol 2,3-dioxygenase-like lactoylglutathione lyase family enzyme